MASHQWRFTRLFSLSLSLSASLSLSLSLCLSPSRETISSNLPLNFRRPCRPYARETNSTNARWKEQRRGGGDRGWGEGAGGGEGRGGETRAGSRVSTSLSKQSTCLVTWTRRILFVAINSQRGGEITLFFWIARWSGMQSIPVFSAALRSEGRPNVSGKKLFLH